MVTITHVPSDKFSYHSDTKTFTPEDSDLRHAGWAEWLYCR